jgi:glucose-1-phosphate thymidylyltransferase
METDEFLQKAQVVVIAGGLGTRLAHRTCENIPKALLNIDGKTLVEIAIEPFVNAGCEDFVFLLGHLGEKVRQFVGEHRLVTNAKFFVEDKRLGKGGALKNALDQNLIDRTRPSFVIYPDDIINDREFPKKLAKAHLKGVQKGCCSTVVRVDRTRYRYGLVKADKAGVVNHFEEKPWVNYPANTGIYVFGPDFYSFLDRFVDLAKAPVELEEVVMPEVVKEKKLFTYTVPAEQWIPVNEEKEFQQAAKVFGKAAPAQSSQ